MSRVAIVGEAPPAAGAASPFDPAARSGRRLAALLGRDLGRFATYNLLDSWPGPSSKGSAFPAADARAAAAALLPELARHRRVVVAGKRAARALGFRERYLVWAPGPAGGLWAVLPHPSGVNRWWNDPANLDAARRFLAKLRA